MLAPACGGGTSTLKGDEGQVERLIHKECEYQNKGDWQSLYNCFSPNYRDAYPYDEFADDMNVAMGLLRAFGGKGKITVENIKVKVDEDVAFATYVVKLGGDVIESCTVGDEDAFVRYNGKWYDVEEKGLSSGYNEIDAAKIRAAMERSAYP